MDFKVEKLSNGILLKIFEFLDAKSLKNAALVCKHWNNIIRLSASTMNKFTLKLYHKSEKVLWVDKFDEIMSLKRNFQSIDVNCDDSRAWNAIELFIELTAHHGSQIRSLTLHKADFKHSKDFCTILKNVPMLEHLEISRTKFSLPESEKNNKVRSVPLKHLKSIKVVYSSWVLFKYFMGSKITQEFSLVLSTAQVRKSERENLVSFLEISNTLKSFEMDREAYERIFEFDFTRSFPFNLKKFKFFSYTFKSEVNQVDENFINFLASQASSLEELSLEFSSREILQTIFTRLEKLTKLTLNSNSLPTDKEFYDQLIPLENLKEIYADDRIPNEIAAMGLLGNCPNLEVLKVDCDPHEVISNILPFIAVENPKLRIMHIDTLKVHHNPEVEFKYLEALHVFFFKNSRYLLAFLRNNPTVKTLKVKWIYDEVFVDEILDALMNTTNVQHLKFGGKPETMKTIYDKVKGDNKKLKSLELNFKTETGLHTLLIDFPLDFAKWDPKWEVFGIQK